MPVLTPLTETFCIHMCNHLVALISCVNSYCKNCIFYTAGWYTSVRMTNLNISYIGKSESFTQKLRSILAQFEFAHEVRKWQAKGVPFQTHLYVPEIHPVTQMPFCEREDEAHVLKVRSNVQSCQSV